MMNDLLDWLILVGAVAAGYFVVSKVIDYFRAGSAWEKGPETPEEYSGNWSDDERR